MSIKQKVFSMLALLLMTAVGARAQATYTVTVKNGTEDAARWSATPNPAGEGQTVTVKYNGKKKVKRVTAVKTATADLGKIVGADGIIYDTKAAAEAAGTQAVAMIAYVGSETGHATYKHGLAIALSDANGGSTCAWSGTRESAGVSSSETMTDHKAFLNGIADTQTLIAKYGNDYAAAKATAYESTVAAPAGTSGWFLPSSGQWLKFFEAAGVNVAGWTAWDWSPGGGSDYTKVHDLMETASTGSSVKAGWYWSSSEYYDRYNRYAVVVGFSSPYGVYLDYVYKDYDNYYVRSFLAF